MGIDFSPLMAMVLVPIPLLATYPKIAKFIATSGYLRAATGAFAIAGTAALLVTAVPPFVTVLLVAPFYQLIVVRMLYGRFLERRGREPKDAAFNFEPGLVHDRSLAMGFGLFGLFPPLGALAWCVWGLNNAVT